MNTAYISHSQAAPPMHPHATSYPHAPQHHPVSHLPTMPANGMPPMAPIGYDGGYAAQRPMPPMETVHSTPQVAENKVAPVNLEEQFKPFIGEKDGRRYELDVVQQPERARMCGFGDKDRRPITPPPCVRLIVTDIASGKEVDCNSIEYSFFVLQVDLWSGAEAEGRKEVNLVKSTTATPSISSTTPVSFAQVESSSAAAPSQFPHLLPSAGRDPAYGQMQFHHPTVNPYGQMHQQSYPGYGMQHNGYSPSGYYPTDHHYSGVAPLGSQSFRPPVQYDQMPQRLMGGNQPGGMFTRNLIGMLASSAFRLSDPDEKIGIWFVLQDLSVRTEGIFRLRFSFVDVGTPDGKVTKAATPVLASCFSKPFQVFSAKKFPGVCESTELSKCFASQGIKIPIRKEGANAKGGDDDDDDV